MALGEVAELAFLWKPIILEAIMAQLELETSLPGCITDKTGFYSESKLLSRFI